MPLREAKSFDDLWDESSRMSGDAMEKTVNNNHDHGNQNGNNHLKNSSKAMEFDTRRFAKHSKNKVDAIETEIGAPTSNATTTTTSVTTPSTTATKTTPTSRKRQPHKLLHPTAKDQVEINQNEKKAALSPSPAKKIYKDKDEAIATLEKQLDRVSFLQKRQYDQLSSLKRMLLESRAKEREHLDTNEELGKALEAKEAQIAEMEQQMENQSSMRDLRHKLRMTETKIKHLEANPIPAIQYSDEEIEKKLQQKDARIAELEEQLEARNGESGIALGNAESKLKKKTQTIQHLNTELEEIRSQLITAQMTIETLEEERNFSQAKLSQLNDMVHQKGGMTNAETELLERAAEIANLSSKLKSFDGKIQERDDKIYKLEEEIKRIDDLVKQLSDIFCAEDDQLKYQQDLLVESAESPAQSCNLLLMTMMNMLETLKNKMAALKQERDDSNAKASDRGIQLAESHIRVDKLRTELRRLRAERTKLLGQKASPDAATPRRSNVQNATSAPSSSEQQRRNSTGPAAAKVMHNGSERSMSTAPQAGGAAASAKPSRFMNFIKSNLRLEEEPPQPQPHQHERRQQQQNNRQPVVTMT